MEALLFHRDIGLANCAGLAARIKGIPHC